MIEIVIDTKTLKRLVIAFLEAKLGRISIKESDVSVLVKTKQNYRAEWEDGE